MLSCKTGDHYVNSRVRFALVRVVEAALDQPQPSAALRHALSEYLTMASTERADGRRARVRLSTLTKRSKIA